MNNLDSGKLVLKLRQQEEEAQLMKADLFQKIQMYESELQALRSNRGAPQAQNAAPGGQAPAQTPPRTDAVIKLSDSTFQVDNLGKAMPHSSRATDDKYAEMSVNQSIINDKHKDLLNDSKNLSREELNETRIRPSPTKADGSSHSSPQRQ